MPPAPAQVPYNDWRRLPVAPLAAFVPTDAVSLVIPCHQVPAATLAKTFATLERQRYPRHLVEVVLVDDGSEPPLQAPPSPLTVKVVRQARRGYGTWRARNAGVAAAAHDIVLFLDADELVDAQWIPAHARWHHVASDLLTAGPRCHAATAGLDVEAVRRQDLRELMAALPTDRSWAQRHFARSDDELALADDLFRVVVGGNFGMRRAFYQRIGGCAPFNRWGAEDVELAHRAFAYGAVIVPVREASVWHQGRWAESREAKRRDRLTLEGKTAHLISHPRWRAVKPGRTYRVPQHVVAVAARGDASPRAIASLVERLLADRVHDLVVRLELPGAEGPSGERALEHLHNQFDDEPRVVMRRTDAACGAAQTALDEFPTAAFHIRLPAAATYRGELVGRLRRKLGQAVRLACVLPTHDGPAVLSITRTWALHRGFRTGAPLEAFGDVKTATPAALRVAAVPAQGASTMRRSNGRGLFGGLRKRLTAFTKRA